MAEDAPKSYDFTDALPTWTAWMDAWERDIWPFFRARGISKSAALMVWHLNQVKNMLEGPEDEDWRG